MVMFDETALVGRGTPSDTPEQQNGSLSLPWGGGDFSDTAGKQHGGTQFSDISVLGGISEEGGVVPLEAVGAT